MKALLDMASLTNSLASLCMFYDSVESHIRGLSLLGKSDKPYGDMLVPIIISKLTTEVRHNLAREHSNSQCILSDLLAAFQGFLSLDYLINRTQLPRQLQVPFKLVQKVVDQPVPVRRKGPVCVFCKGVHPTHACETVTDHQNRLEIVKRHR